MSHNEDSIDYSYVDVNDIENNPWIEVRVIEGKGRCVFSKRVIPKGTIIFKDTPYAAIIDSQHKSCICTTCFKELLESNKHNVQTCPGCRIVKYCSNYCKEYNKIEVKHTELECKWINNFSISFKHQLTEDDRNIILLLLKIIARRVHEKQSLIFHNVKQQAHKYDDEDDNGDSGNDSGCSTTPIMELPTSNNNNLELLPMIPNDVVDLIDHLDDYYNNALNNPGTTDDIHTSTDDNDKENKEELNKFIKIWKNDFKKLINISKIVQIIIDDNDGKEGKEDTSNVSGGNSVMIDNEGDSEMTDLSNDPDGLDILVEQLKSSDLNILRLLCKVRSNYFGLWHIPDTDIIPTPPPQTIEQQTKEEEEINNLSNIDSEIIKEYDIKNSYIWCGSAVYLKLSLFNHSCAPQCKPFLEFNNKSKESYTSCFIDNNNPFTISIKTLIQIEQDTELFITYVPLNQKRQDRIKCLKSNWLFQCNCNRCTYESSKN